jgi:hypothetical protein
MRGLPKRPTTQLQGVELELHGGDTTEKVWINFENEDGCYCKPVLHEDSMAILRRKRKSGNKQKNTSQP